jgi:hypothetical protein
MLDINISQSYISRIDSKSKNSYIKSEQKIPPPYYYCRLEFSYELKEYPKKYDKRSNENIPKSIIGGPENPLYT